MLVKITDQGTEFEFTVVLKLNQGTIRKKRRIFFPGSFFDTFLEKQKSYSKKSRSHQSIALTENALKIIAIDSFGKRTTNHNS